MELLDHPGAPLSLDVLITRQKITGKNRTALDGAITRIDGILALIDAARPASNGSPMTTLRKEADAAEQALIAAPTRENLERFHDAVIRHEDAIRSFPRADAALNYALRREVDGLVPIALGVMDAVLADFETEATRRRAEIEEGDRVFGVSGDAMQFDLRAARTRELVAGERVQIQQSGAALAWLAERGFCRNPYVDPKPPVAAEGTGIDGDFH